MLRRNHRGKGCGTRRNWAWKDGNVCVPLVGRKDLVLFCRKMYKGWDAVDIGQAG